MNFTDEELFLIRDGLGLKWSSLVKEMSASSDTQNVRYMANCLVTVITLYERFDDILTSQV